VTEFMICDLRFTIWESEFGKFEWFEARFESSSFNHQS